MNTEPKVNIADKHTRYLPTIKQIIGYYVHIKLLFENQQKRPIVLFFESKSSECGKYENNCSHGNS